MPERPNTGSTSPPLVSIIMPAYNAGSFIREAIESVLAQDHEEWELIVVNDGSTDGTGTIASSFTDPRIQVVHQENRGIGGARNRALELIRGEFLVTLDADDVMPPQSVSSRLAVLLADPDLSFADGSVLMMDRTLTTILKRYTPTFTGEPLAELLKLNGSCFFGTTWMIRKGTGMELRFDEDTSHAEDLLFYLSVSKGRKYGFTRETVLHYRRTGTSAMSNLDGLARGYAHIVRWLKARPELLEARERERFERKCDMIMARSYLRNKEPMKALAHVFGIRTPTAYPKTKRKREHAPQTKPSSVNRS